MNPTTNELRMSRSQIQLLSRGADIIIYYCSDLRLAEYDPPLYAEILQVAGYLRGLLTRPSAKTHRVRLNALGLAVCMFGIRSVGREIRRGQIRSLQWPEGVDKNRLLRKLETHRKRAKRRWLRTGDSAAYKDWSKRWRRFLSRVNESLRPIRNSTLRDYYRRRLDQLVPIVTRVLAEETNENLPPDQELRQMVRKMCRHIRRERAPVTMKDLWVCSAAGRDFIASHMLKLIAQSRIQDPSSDPPQPTLQSLATA